MPISLSSIQTKILAFSPYYDNEEVLQIQKGCLAKKQDSQNSELRTKNSVKEKQYSDLKFVSHVLTELYSYL